MPVDHLSIKTYIEEKDNFDARAVIIHGYAVDNEFTDRQIKEGLDFDDMNMVRPRITELIARGWMEKVGKTECPVTTKTVRIVKGLKQRKHVEPKAETLAFYVFYSEERDEGIAVRDKKQAQEWCSDLEKDGFYSVNARVVKLEKKTPQVESL